MLAGFQLGVVEEAGGLVQPPQGPGRRHRRRRRHPRLAPPAVPLRLPSGLHAGPAVRPRRVPVRHGRGAQVARRGVPRQGRALRGRRGDQPPDRRQAGRARRLLRLRGRHARRPPRLGPRRGLRRRRQVLGRHGPPRHRRRLRRRARRRPPEPAGAEGALRLAPLAQDRRRLRRLAPRLRQGILARRRQDVRRRRRAGLRGGGDMELAGLRRRRPAVAQPGPVPAGAGGLGGGGLAVGHGVRLRHQGGAAGGRARRAVAAARPVREGGRHDRLAAGEVRHVRRQPRHRVDAEAVAVPGGQGDAGLRLHPHPPGGPLHLLRPHVRLEPQGGAEQAGGDQGAQRHPRREQAADPRRRRRPVRGRRRREGVRQDWDEVRHGRRGAVGFPHRGARQGLLRVGEGQPPCSGREAPLASPHLLTETHDTTRPYPRQISMKRRIYNLVIIYKYYSFTM